MTSLSGVPDLKNSDGYLVVEAADKCNLLNNTFAQNFILDNNILPQAERVAPDGVSLLDIEFNPYEVRLILKRRKGKLSHSPDSIPEFVLKKTVVYFIYSVDNYFCEIL